MTEALTLNDLLDRATRAFNAGRMAEAERWVRAGLKSHPGQPDLLHLLGLVGLSARRYADATKLLAAAVAAAPDRWSYWYNLGVAQYRGQRNRDACVSLGRAIALNAEHAPSHNMLGAALLALGEPIEAEAAFAEAMARDAADPGIRLNRANALALIGRGTEAEELLDELAEGHPDHPELWAQRGLIAYRDGRFEDARTAYRRALALRPESGDLHHRLALTQRCTDPDSTELKAAERALAARPPVPERIPLHFALAKMHDELGHFDVAFEHADAGKALEAQRRPFDPEAFGTEIRQIREHWGPARFGSGGSDDPRPVFIVGMPRSGTTLLEQLLCRHPAVASAGELTWFQRLAESGDGAHAPLDPDRADDYLERLCHGAGSARRVIDKNPTNFLYLGPIAALFPQATVIHVRRRPTDTIRSIYFTRFVHGQAWSNRLDWLGAFYAGYLELMAHWREVLPRPMLEVDYEALTERPADALKPIIERLELDWRDDLMARSEPKGTIATASAWQARQPVYRTSVDRGAAYSKHLEPALRWIPGYSGTDDR